MITNRFVSKTLFAAAFSVASFFICSSLRAQVKIGNNPGSINGAAILDLESTNKGLLLPRVALTATNAATPLSAHVAGMTVYNTAVAGAAPYNVTPGVYFNDGSKWAKVNPVESDLTYVSVTNPTQLLNNVTQWQEFKFQTESGDALNEYNPVTGKFTVARSGLYTIAFNTYCQCSNAPFEATLNVDINAVQYPGSTYRSQVAGYFSSSFTLPIKLTAGDVVFPRIYSTVSGCIIASNASMIIMQVR